MYRQEEIGGCMQPLAHMQEQHACTRYQARERQDVPESHGKKKGMRILRVHRTPINLWRDASGEPTPWTLGCFPADRCTQIDQERGS
jgi:hypothetical protein